LLLDPAFSVITTLDVQAYGMKDSSFFSGSIGMFFLNYHQNMVQIIKYAQNSIQDLKSNIQKMSAYIASLRIVEEYCVLPSISSAANGNSSPFTEQRGRRHLQIEISQYYKKRRTNVRHILRSTQKSRKMSTSVKKFKKWFS
jgi:hypothetical protein